MAWHAAKHRQGHLVFKVAMHRQHPIFLSSPTAWSPRFVAEHHERAVLGSGTYGQVVLVVDQQTHRRVAMKISRREAAYRRSARTEVDVIRRLQTVCPHVVKFVDCFETADGFVHCIVELMDLNVYDYMRAVQFQPIALDVVRAQAESLFRALAEMHGAGYMHCDIKPENVMLRSRERPRDIALIDFGSARKLNENKYYDVQSLWYRAPEVICGFPYTPAIDMWSMGCLLYEIHTGQPVFPGEDPQSSLSLMIAAVGCPSDEVVQGGSLSRQLRFHAAAVPGAAQVLAEDRFACADVAELRAFANLLRGLLHPDPLKRLSAADALRHPFIAGLDNDHTSSTAALPEFDASSLEATPEALREVGKPAGGHSATDAAAPSSAFLTSPNESLTQITSPPNSLLGEVNVLRPCAAVPISNEALSLSPLQLTSALCASDGARRVGGEGPGDEPLSHGDAHDVMLESMCLSSDARMPPPTTPTLPTPKVPMSSSPGHNLRGVTN